MVAFAGAIPGSSHLLHELPLPQGFMMNPGHQAGGDPAFRDNYGVDARRLGVPGEPTGADPARPIGEEGELVASILRNDRKAAARFVAAHIDAVHAYVRYRLTPRAELVDDVVQDVFLAALTGLRTFQGQSALRTWVIAIARHKIEDVYRDLLRRPVSLDAADSAEDEPAAPAVSFEEQIDSARTRNKARHVLAQLPERYGLLLIWRYWERRSTRDIATAIDATEKAVERTLARARARFKALWVKG